MKLVRAARNGFDPLALITREDSLLPDPVIQLGVDPYRIDIPV
jgi:hypothetical protein